MKKTLPFIFLLLLIFQINAQAQKNTFPLELINYPISKQVFNGINQHPMASSELLDSVYYWMMDTSTMAWHLYDKETNFVYDANQNNISYINQSWNDTIWSNQDQITSNYDNYNNKINQVAQTWNGSTWVNNGQTVFGYDANNNDTSVIREAWNSGAWLKTFLYTYTYDVNNNKISFLDQYWSGSNLVNQYKSTYLYNTNNKMISQSVQFWNGTAWVYTEKHI